MQTPYRKPGKFSLVKSDPLMTQAKCEQLKNKLKRLKEQRPDAAAEVARLAELGDFSENAEYQHAKWKLRSINDRMAGLENQIMHAAIIKPTSEANLVQLGHKVTVETGGKQKTYQILGSSETNPQKGVISHSSPIGAAIMGCKVGDTVKIKLMSEPAKTGKKEVVYKIIKISA